RISTGHEPECVSFTPDAASLIIGFASGSVTVWTHSGLIRRVGLGNGRILCVAVSPDGKWIAFGGYDGSLGLWQTGTDRVRMLRHSEARVMTVAFSPDSRLIAAGG